MSDLDTKTLFHNPDELSKEELARLRGKIRMQMYLPYVCGLSMPAFLLAVRGHRANFDHFLMAAALGLGAGNLGVQTMRTTVTRPDSDILRAWDERLVKQTFAVSGLNTNYTALAHNDEFKTHRTY